MIIHVCPVCSSQIAYLENLLKVYNEEICRLQQAELSLTDMEAEDSLYIQEHKLKRKVSLQCGAARWLPLSNTDIKAVKINVYDSLSGSCSHLPHVSSSFFSRWWRFMKNCVN